MSEFAFLIRGGFDVKSAPPALNGLFSLTNAMSAHGADAQTWKEATTRSLRPEKVPAGHLGIMFESRYGLHIRDGATALPWLIRLAGISSESQSVQTTHG